MRTTLRAWLVLGTSCAVLGGCSPAPPVSKTTATPASPSAMSVSLAGGWSSGGNLSTARGGQMTGVLIQGGRLLVTGPSSDFLETGNVDIYDPASGWSQGPTLSSPRVGAAAAPLPGGRALLAGGFPEIGGHDGPGPGPLATATTYNPSSSTWTNVPNMSTARAFATATALPDGRVLVAGGYCPPVILLTNPTRERVQPVTLAGSLIFK